MHCSVLCLLVWNYHFEKVYYKTFQEKICLQGENDVQPDMSVVSDDDDADKNKPRQHFRPLIPLSEIISLLNHVILLTSYD